MVRWEEERERRWVVGRGFSGLWDQGFRGWCCEVRVRLMTRTVLETRVGVSKERVKERA
jgi:hypothetical protein